MSSPSIKISASDNGDLKTLQQIAPVGQEPKGTLGKINDQFNTAAAVESAKAALEALPVTDGVKLTAPELVPSNWSIKIVDSKISDGGCVDIIYAKNDITGRLFEGTMKEFNAFLKG